ncbi:hybrid sensor histidine kinase/response regulator transcription factor [Salisaeta longa]|uniref:hybrid sensor histidine kinase/response regulator transcription factor n=1 Tax=Salisaeta longa TaxID=503170 RepID=UPI0003B4E8C2|nr:ATP-binding protein [Salisaeta longa]
MVVAPIVHRCLLVGALLATIAVVWGPPTLLWAQQPATASGLEVAEGYQAVHWTAEDGLPVDAVNGLARGPRGYLWASTYDGLVRFDGVRFTTVRTDTHPAFPSNRLVQLVRGPDGALWMTTEQPVLVRYDPRTDSVRTFQYRPDRAADPVDFTYLRVADDILWVGTQHGLLRVADDGRPAAGPALVPVGPPNGAVVHLDAVGDTLWVLNDRHHLWRYAEGDLRPVPFASRNVPKRPLRLAIDAQHRPWLLAGLTLYGLREGVLQAVGSVPWSGPDTIGHLLPMPNGTVLLGMEEGAYRFSEARLTAWRTTGVPIQPMWAEAATSLDDLRYPRERPHRVEAAHGHWLGISATPRHPSGTVFHDSTPVLHLPGPINGVLKDGEGHVWIASGTAGLVRLAPTPLRSYGAPEGMAVPNVYPVVPDPTANDAVWAGTLLGDALVHIAGNTVTPYDTSPVRVVWSILPRPDGTVWMGTNGDGVIRLSLPPDTAKTPRPHITRLTTADGLSSNLIRSLYEDPDGRLWIGTEDRGLVRLDRRGTASPTDDRIAPVTTADGLFANSIHQILPDDQGRLWMSTNQGIFWVHQEALNAVADGEADHLFPTAYTEHHGLRNREANGGVHAAGTRTASGRLWFPTQAGVVAMDPARVRSGPHNAPRVVIEHATVNGETRKPLGTSLRLDAEAREMAIRYTGISFYRPRDVRFRYRLSGGPWTDAGTRRVAYFTNLDPGRHTFEVQATHGSDAWHAPTARLTFVVTPRWWETGWFKALVVLAGLGLIGAAGWGRVRWLEVQRQRLQQLVAQRTEEIQTQNQRLSRQSEQLVKQARRLQEVDAAKSRFFANVSHELRTPLTLILGPVRWLRQGERSPEATDEQLALVEHHAARLQRLVDQLLDLAQLDAGSLRVQARPVNVVAAVRRLAQSFAGWAEEEGLTLTFHHDVRSEAAKDVVQPPSASTESVYADPQHLDQIVSNLLANALKYTPAGGHVDVRVMEDDAGVCLTVTDTGPGLSAAAQERVFERFVRGEESSAGTGAGLGLPLARDLVRLHGGTLTLDSAPGDGTTVTVTLQRGSDHLHADQLVAAADAEADGQGDGLRDPGERGGPSGDDLVVVPTGGNTDAITAQPLGQGASPSGDGQNDGRRLVLVVDDHASVRQHIRTVLGDAYRLAEAATGTEGVAQAEALLPDLILADVMMPKMDGLTMTRQLKGNPVTASIPIVLLTARGGTHAEAEGLETGADDYITKPFAPRVLEARVRGMFALQERLRERLRDERRSEPSDSGAAVGSTSTPDEDPRPHAAAARTVAMRHLSDPDFGVAELAAALDTTRSTLYRRLRAEGSPSPSELLRTVRLDEARRLLAEDAGTVTEVAYAVGYENLSAFSRAFREHFDATPSEMAAP